MQTCLSETHFTCSTLRQALAWQKTNTWSFCFFISEGEKVLQHWWQYQKFLNQSLLYVKNKWMSTSTIRNPLRASKPKQRKGNNIDDLNREYLRGKYHCTIDLLFDLFGISCMTTDNFLQNRLIQTSQTGGQRYSDTSLFSILWLGWCSTTVLLPSITFCLILSISLSEIQHRFGLYLRLLH